MKLWLIRIIIRTKPAIKIDRHLLNQCSGDNNARRIVGNWIRLEVSGHSPSSSSSCSPIFFVNFITKTNLFLFWFAGEMYIGCESRYGLHQLPHWNPKFERRKRGESHHGFFYLILSESLLISNIFLWAKVHLLRLTSGGSELICEGLFSHPNEIWDLSSCPFDQRIFSTVFSTGTFLSVSV